MYYNHIERDSHHFQYYIRTNSLIKAIIENENDKLDLFCSQVNSVLFESESSSDKSRRIDVIVVPIHYSNEHFLNIIAKKIFKNSVEIIAFDPQKEYRSNFETKYSNYAYVIEASASKTCVHFHFVDDQIITGHTFYQAKSFVNSLVRSTITNTLHKGEKPKVIVFDSIITMVDRNSNSSKSNYITDVSRFFSLIDICVPSMRNHGDSCHLCSKSKNAELIKRNSALYGMSKYWEEKETYYTVKMLQDAKGIALAQNMEMTKRKFRRFYCENLLWKKLKNDWGSDKHIYIELVTLIAAEISKLDRKNQYEYIISFIKVMSKPFIYYRENFKKAVHAMMLYFTFIINKNYNINPSKIFYILKHVPYGTHKDVYKHIEKSFNALNENHINHTCFKEKYYLYIILLSRLCAINSNYLLKYNNIENALYFYDEISYNFSLNEQNEIKPISDNIAHLIKSVTNGISGKHKAKKLDFELINSKINSKYLTIVRNIYLENLEADAETEEKENLFSIGVSTRQKYINVLKRLVKNSSAWFMTNLYQSSNCFPLAENIINGEKIMSFFEDEKFNRGEDICFTTDFVGIKCYQSENNQDIVYLIIQNSNNPEELDFEGLKFIRSILKFRYALYNELEKDIHSGAIKELYQDDKWLEIFAQPKVVSHGQSEDIEKHLKNIENKFLLYQSYENRVEPKYSDIVSDLTLFSNLLISFLYSKKIADDRDLKYKFSEQLEIVELKYIKTMHSNNEKNTDQNGLLNFDDYRSLLKNENLYELFIERFNYYLGCMCRHGVEIDLIIDEIKMIDSVISFQSSYKYSIWFSIVIIHTLIKNAIQHGDKSEKISIHMQKRENSIDLIVKNKTLNNLLYSGKGITKKALQHAFESKPFSISFEDIKETNEFIVKITNFFGGVT